jgi:small conductance mechanosensitive channel
VLLFVTASLIALANLGINITPILASFSIFSAAVGLAAKDIIQSFLQGVMLLIEENLLIGEFIKINDMIGIVEKLSVRALQLRDEDGSVHVIPYNCVNSITNYSKEYSRHFDSLRLSSWKDVEKGKQILADVVKRMREEPEYKDIIIGDVIIHGLKPFDLTGLKIYWEVRTTPMGEYVPCEIYDRLINEFNKNGIEIPMATSINATSG